MNFKCFCTATALCVGSFSMASAQLVFVPDVNLRACLDSLVPGVVDANGYIDSNGPLALGVQNLNIEIDWSPADITGLEAFVNLAELRLINYPWDPVVDLTCSAWPNGLLLLDLWQNFNLPALPPLPPDLEYLRLGATTGLTNLPPLPGSLDDLVLVHCTDLLVVPMVPDTMHTYEVQDCGALQAISNIPSVVWGVVLHALPLSTLPALPDSVTSQISFSELYAVTALPPLPASVGFQAVFSSLSSLDSLPPFPSTCPRLRFAGMVPGLVITDLPLDLQELEISDGGPTCLPALPASLTLFSSSNSTTTCLPNLPAGTMAIWDNDTVPANEVPICNLLNSLCASTACGISGAAFWDLDADGTWDTGEPALPHWGAASALPGGLLAGLDGNGKFNFGVPPGSYTITYDASSQYVQSMSPAFHGAVFSLWSEVDTVNDFSLILQPNVQDLGVDMAMIKPAVPGHTARYALHCTNLGTQVQDGTITMTIDDDLLFASSAPAPTTANGNVLTWDFASLGLGGSLQILINLLTPSGLMLGTPVVHVIVADPVATDQTPANNSITMNHVVVAAYDPNDKAVSPTALTPAQVAAEERLTYTIRFQNTGTWPATRVVLTDTLSTDLQWNTMQAMAASHAHTWFISNGVLHVVFDNINLPDSNANEPESHGFFKFSMKPVTTLVLGDAVSNTANIYFDFNEPVITNAAVFTVDNNVGTPETAQPTLHLSPNPVSDVLAVELTGTASNQVLHVVDVTGRTVLRAVATGTRTLLDVHTLKPGSYHVRVGDGMVGRFVKR